MKIAQAGIAGTLESSDIMVTVEPGGKGIHIDLDSPVEKQYGRAIRQVITETLAGLGVEQARVTAVDKGALDCAIRARVRTAVLRACQETTFDWGAV